MERQLIHSAASKALSSFPYEGPLLAPHARLDGRRFIGFYYLVGFELVHLVVGRYGPLDRYRSIRRLSDIDTLYDSRFQP